ncbi:hypothetical protein F5888DRAFT_1160065 [Russula emetica]|nr:hypothetical protein F5888DRAFT_1160065 [Russula emetica]
MSIGRLSSMLSIASTSTRIVAVILLAGFLPGAKADCWVDENTNEETCDGLSNLARALIGLAFFLVFLGVIFSLFAFRRRRNRQANLAYIQQTRQGSGGASYGSPYSTGAGGPPPFAPQYPPPTHNGVNYPYNYDPASGFAPVPFRSGPAAVLCAATWRAPVHIAQVNML